MRSLIGVVILLYLMVGCATRPYDYSNFKKYHPKSVLVIPPLNKSTDMRGTYSCMSSITQPLAELGYYVFPVAVVDQLFKQNGMPTPGEMHQVSLKKISEIINPDAVLYVVVEDYGTKFQLMMSSSSVTLSAKLVDTKTGTVLWEGKEFASDQNGNQNGNFASKMIGAMVSQVIDSSTDRSADLCSTANYNLFNNSHHGLLPGPYLGAKK